MSAREALERRIAAIIAEHVEIGYSLRPDGLVDPDTFRVTGATGAASVAIAALTPAGGMETSADAREAAKRQLDAHPLGVVSEGDSIPRNWLAALLRDFSRLQTELARLSTPPADVAGLVERAHARAQDIRDHNGVAPTAKLLDELATSIIALSAKVKERVWRCFHCDEAFTTEEAAREHFGRFEECTPVCRIDAAEYRRMEDIHQRHLIEDDDASREFHRMRADHAVALRKEEENGYERGLNDAGPDALTRAEAAEARVKEVEAARDEARTELRKLEADYQDVAQRLGDDAAAAEAAEAELVQVKQDRDRQLEAARDLYDTTAAALTELREKAKEVARFYGDKTRYTTDGICRRDHGPYLSLIPDFGEFARAFLASLEKETGHE